MTLVAMVYTHSSLIVYHAKPWSSPHIFLSFHKNPIEILRARLVEASYSPQLSPNSCLAS